MSKEAIDKHLKTLLGYIDIAPEVTIEEDGEAFRIDIHGDDLNFLIGYRGESLDALQYILSHAVYKDTSNWIPLTLDINGYRKQKLEKLEEMVMAIVDRVRFHQKEIKLPPLSPFERRHIHLFIEEYVDVNSESRGEGRQRRLFLIPK